MMLLIILPGKENVCIKVRVLRLWKVPAFLNPSDSSSLEMVLVDEKVSIFYMSVSCILVTCYGYNFIYICSLYIMICWLCIMVERSRLLLGSNWFICLNRSLKRDKSMSCPISLFFSPKWFLSYNSSPIQTCVPN
jgi:hypothetical protein